MRPVPAVRPRSTLRPVRDVGLIRSIEEGRPGREVDRLAAERLVVADRGERAALRPALPESGARPAFEPREDGARDAAGREPRGLDPCGLALCGLALCGRAP
jgi:hypothetical protein